MRRKREHQDRAWNGQTSVQFDRASDRLRPTQFRLTQRAAAIIRYEAIEAIRQSNAGKCTANDITTGTANASGKLKLLTNIIGGTLSTLNQTLRMLAFMLGRNFRTEENADEHP
jgi:hypothetical protein